MEDKILITSKSSAKARKIILGIAFTFLIISIILFLINAADGIDDYRNSGKAPVEYSYLNNNGEWESRYKYPTGKNIYESFNSYGELLLAHPESAFLWIRYIFNFSRPWLYLLILNIGFMLIMFLLYKSYLNSNLTITEKNVIGKSLLGQNITLPIDKISAYSTTSIFSSITISTSSETIWFSFIENHDEIGKVLTSLINTRQETTQPKTPSKTNMNIDNFEELKKLKELLDAEIITQEEFDSKKKQLLDL